MPYYRYLLSLIIFSIGFPPLPSANIHFKNLTVKDGLSHTTVYAIYQDENGAMWFGGLEGVNRYNGTSITTYRPTPGGDGLAENEIMAICGDRNGSVYIQALHDLVEYDVRTEKFSRIMEDSAYNIVCQDGDLWVLTTNQLLVKGYGDNDFRTFHNFEVQNRAYRPMCVTDSAVFLGGSDGLVEIPQKSGLNLTLRLENEDITSLCPDSSGYLWVGTRNNGVFRISPDGSLGHFSNEPLNQNSLSNNQVRSIICDENGNIWIGTYRGLDRFDPLSEVWISFPELDTDKSAAYSSVFALYRDDGGGIWVGTYYGGVSYFHPNNDYSQTYYADSSIPSRLNYPIVGSIVSGGNERLWVGTEGGGLNSFNTSDGSFSQWPLQQRTSDNIKCLWFDEASGRLYIGTHARGLIIMDTNSGYSRIIDSLSGLPDNSINSMQLAGGKLIISTRSGLIALDPLSEKFETLSKNQKVIELTENHPHDTFHVDKEGNLWLAYWGGGVRRINLKSGETKFFGEEKDMPGNFRVVDIFESKDGLLYFATVGSGVYVFESAKESFRRFSEESQSIYSDYCYFISETTNGEIVVLHNQGVSFVDPITGLLRYSFTTPDISFCQGSSIFCASDGAVYLGGVGGMLRLSPSLEEQFSDNTGNYYFDRLIVNNNTVIPGDDTGILTATLPLTEKISLPHSSNNIVIELGSPDFSSRQYKYEYRLKGFDDSWLPLYSSQISYTNLAPGSYTLSIRKLSPSNEVCAENSLEIYVQPPLYANIYAYILYVLILIAMIIAIIRVKTRQAALKASIEYERMEKEKIDELDKSKMRFFTNISHEFRTPLTLIIAQLESLLQLDSLPAPVYNRLLRVYKSSSRLTALVSELLDIHKQTQGHLRLRVSQNDIVAFARDIFLSFDDYARSKQIRYEFSTPFEKMDMWFDPEQIRKVLVNLISNAFKHTPDGGSIALNLTAETGFIALSVSDTGSGIPRDAIEKIFERFYQINDRPSQFSLGTGIGLALAKGITELHHGRITVESDIGMGSKFTVWLPLGFSHFAEDEIVSGNPSPVSVDTRMLSIDDELNSEIFNKPGDVGDDGKPVVLLVEDNADVLGLLTEIFSSTYDVKVAHDGQEGLDIAKSILPDLIVSDVMMPRMSGKKMCYKLKNNVATSHIPIVLLTAQSSVEYAVEGFMYGADDYIVKPFNVKLLLSRCNNLIKSRRLLFERFSNGEVRKNQGEERMTSPAVSPHDQAFLDKAVSIIKDNFANPDFNMDSLATEMGVGRNKLYTLVKEITGITPNELSLSLKFDESKRLLDDRPDLNISDISALVGFSTAAYFGRCFKSVFGISPMAYRNRTKS